MNALSHMGIKVHLCHSTSAFVTWHLLMHKLCDFVAKATPFPNESVRKAICACLTKPSRKAIEWYWMARGFFAASMLDRSCVWRRERVHVGLSLCGPGIDFFSLNATQNAPRMLCPSRRVGQTSPAFLSRRRNNNTPKFPKVNLFFTSHIWSSHTLLYSVWLLRYNFKISWECAGQDQGGLIEQNRSGYAIKLHYLKDIPVATGPEIPLEYCAHPRG